MKSDSYYKGLLIGINYGITVRLDNPDPTNDRFFLEDLYKMIKKVVEQ